VALGRERVLERVDDGGTEGNGIVVRLEVGDAANSSPPMRPTSALPFRPTTRSRR